MIAGSRVFIIVGFLDCVSSKMGQPVEIQVYSILLAILPNNYNYKPEKNAELSKKTSLGSGGDQALIFCLNTFARLTAYFAR